MDLTPRTLRDVDFRERRFGGYDPEQVDAFLESAATALDELQARLTRAETDAAEAIRAKVDAEDAARRTLVAAERTADEIVAAAEGRAAELDAEFETRRAEHEASHAEAEAAASAAIEEAQRTAAEQREAAEAEAAAKAAEALEQLEAARAEAAATTDRAIAEAEELTRRHVEEAEASARTMVEDAERRADELVRNAEADAADRSHRMVAAADARVAEAEQRRDQLAADVAALHRFVRSERGRIRDLVADQLERIDAGFVMLEPPALYEVPKVRTIVQVPSPGEPVGESVDASAGSAVEAAGEASGEATAGTAGIMGAGGAAHDVAVAYDEPWPGPAMPAGAIAGREDSVRYELSDDPFFNELRKAVDEPVPLDQEGADHESGDESEPLDDFFSQGPQEAENPRRFFRR